MRRGAGLRDGRLLVTPHAVMAELFGRGRDGSVDGRSACFVWLTGGEESVVLDRESPGETS